MRHPMDRLHVFLTDLVPAVANVTQHTTYCILSVSPVLHLLYLSHLYGQPHANVI